MPCSREARSTATQMLAVVLAASSTAVHRQLPASTRCVGQALRIRGGGAIMKEELQLSLALVQAAVLGSLIGVERGWAGRPAGIRTMSMVAMGAALFTGVGKLSFSDSSRAAAQVASGVGFIGAGVVQARPQQDPKRKKNGKNGGDYLKGLTTAAAIWLCAGIGVACGSGHSLVATVATALAVVILGSHRIAYGSEAESDMWDPPNQDLSRA